MAGKYDREAVTMLGRAAFYAALYGRLRQSAYECGWALAIHGSLNADMDIMAMPWTENATSAYEMIDRLIEDNFADNRATGYGYSIGRNVKPNHRVVYSVPIYADFYLDINTIEL